MMQSGAHSTSMRTTVDIDDSLLERAKKLARREKQTLSGLVGQALAAYLGSRRQASKDPDFVLLVRGTAGGRFPSPAEFVLSEEADDRAALAIPGLKSDAAS